MLRLEVIIYSFLLFYWLFYVLRVTHAMNLGLEPSTLLLVAVILPSEPHRLTVVVIISQYALEKIYL